MVSFSSDLAYPLMMSGTILLGLAMLSLVGLAAWREWIGLQRAKLQQGQSASDGAPDGMAEGDAMVTRIEMADLRERLRQLEAIAAGVDL